MLPFRAVFERLYCDFNTALSMLIIILSYAAIDVKLKGVLKQCITEPLNSSGQWEGQVRRVIASKGQYSEGSLLRRVIIPKGHCYELDFSNPIPNLNINPINNGEMALRSNDPSE